MQQPALLEYNLPQATATTRSQYNITKTNDAWQALQNNDLLTASFANMVSPFSLPNVIATGKTCIAQLISALGECNTS